MKIRKQLSINLLFFSKSSKAFHNNNISSEHNSKAEALIDLVDKILSKIQSPQDQHKSIHAYKQIIQKCYNNKKNQAELCSIIKMPFVPGPIALNSLPDSFFNQEYLNQKDNDSQKQQSVMNQIQYLFDYLKKTKQYYYCWVIYYNEELKLLSIKLMKKFELNENVELLNGKYCLIGIFVDRQVNLTNNSPLIMDLQGSNKKYSKKLKTKQQYEEKQKSSIHSCYDPGRFYKPSSQQNSNKQKKGKKLFKKALIFCSQQSQHINKTANSESIYSLKSIKSSSKTNSSSFKNQISDKNIDIEGGIEEGYEEKNLRNQKSIDKMMDKDRNKNCKMDFKKKKQYCFIVNDGKSKIDNKVQKVRRLSNNRSRQIIRCQNLINPSQMNLTAMLGKSKKSYNNQYKNRIRLIKSLQKIDFKPKLKNSQQQSYYLQQQQNASLTIKRTLCESNNKRPTNKNSTPKESLNPIDQKQHNDKFFHSQTNFFNMKKQISQLKVKNKNRRLSHGDGMKKNKIYSSCQNLIKNKDYNNICGENRDESVGNNVISLMSSNFNSFSLGVNDESKVQEQNSITKVAINSNQSSICLKKRKLSKYKNNQFKRLRKVSKISNSATTINNLQNNFR